FMLPHPPPSTLFPYTTLFRSHRVRLRVGDEERCRRGRRRAGQQRSQEGEHHESGHGRSPHFVFSMAVTATFGGTPRNVNREDEVDRKSTRLNSSHDQISYAVF